MQVVAEQAPQGFDFGFRAFPVFHGKRIERQRLNIEPAAGFDDLAHGFHPGAVPGDARQRAPLCPAAVAVHNDCDVSGQLCRVKLLRETKLSAARRSPLEEFLHCAKLGELRRRELNSSA